MSEHTDKLNTQKKSGQQPPDNCNAKNMANEGPDTSRREFTRNVLVGSAVLLTLTNRSAWGWGDWGDKKLLCVSTNLLMSYRNGQVSALTVEQQEEIRKFEEYLSEAKTDPENIGGDTCYEISWDDGENDYHDKDGSTDKYDYSRLWFDKKR